MVRPDLKEELWLKRFISNEEMECLCEAMIKDFFKSKHYTNSLCVDIEAFVTEYLKLPIVYDSFAESDPGRIGYLSDGIRGLWVRRNGKAEQIVYPAKTVVLDRFLLNPSESARKRFTIAHEGAHEMLNRHVPIQNQPAAAFHSEYDGSLDYTNDMNMLKDIMTLNEYCANRAAACFLMPRFLVYRVLKHFKVSRPLILYEGGIPSQDVKLTIQRLADAMGVSYTAFFNRLRELKLFEIRPVEEYIHQNLQYGGVV